MIPRLRDKGVAVSSPLTRNQQAVLSCLRAAKRPLGAYAILDRVRGVGICAPTTVYRALNDLSGLGLVHRLESLAAFIACEQGSHNHQTAFAVCRDCQRVVEIELRADQLSTLYSLAPTDLAIDQMTLEFTGTCTDCAPTRASTELQRERESG
jgi:Fur family zinc uptake transcriptional regulator